tara:strand:- start:164 stop:292 length:129 start_codon:yes stop_codon:yes gene_type:complete
MSFDMQEGYGADKFQQTLQEEILSHFVGYVIIQTTTIINDPE